MFHGELLRVAAATIPTVVNLLSERESPKFPRSAGRLDERAPRSRLGPCRWGQAYLHARAHILIPVTDGTMASPLSLRGLFVTDCPRRGISTGRDVAGHLRRHLGALLG